MTVTRTLRRRVDYQILRWQARLDGAWADRVLPLGATVGLFVVLAAMALARARSLETGHDLATWVQGAWLVTTGRPAESTITDQHLLEPHFAVGFLAIAQLTRLVAPIPLLVVAQAAALSLGVGAVWRLCRQVCALRVGAATAAIVAYAAHPAIHQLNLADVHPEAFGLPALLWGAYLAMRGRWIPAAALCVVAMSMGSWLGLAVAAVGLGMVLTDRSRGGAALAIGGLAWVAVAQLVVQPWIGDGTFVHQAAFARYGSDGPAVLWGMATAPWTVVGDLVARENFVVLVGLLAPVAFLPVLAPRRLLPFAPALALPMIADVPIAGAEGVEMLVAAVAGIFLALPFALQQIGRRNIERVTVDRRVLVALALASVTFFVLDAPSSPYAHPWEWGARDAADGMRLDVIAGLPDDARVRTAPTLAAEMAERAVIRPVPTGSMPTAAELVEGVDVVILDDAVVESWDVDREDVDELHADLVADGFEVVVDAEGITVFRRAGR